LIEGFRTCSGVEESGHELQCVLTRTIAAAGQPLVHLHWLNDILWNRLEFCPSNDDALLSSRNSLCQLFLGVFCALLQSPFWVACLVGVRTSCKRLRLGIRDGHLRKNISSGAHSTCSSILISSIPLRMACDGSNVWLALLCFVSDELDGVSCGGEGVMGELCMLGVSLPSDARQSDSFAIPGALVSVRCCSMSIPKLSPSVLSCVIRACGDAGSASMTTVTEAAGLGFWRRGICDSSLVGPRIGDGSACVGNRACAGLIRLWNYNGSSRITTICTNRWVFRAITPREGYGGICLFAISVCNNGVFSLYDIRGSSGLLRTCPTKRIFFDPLQSNMPYGGLSLLNGFGAGHG
jgi:hypothetical protein